MKRWSALIILLGIMGCQSPEPRTLDPQRTITINVEVPSREMLERLQEITIRFHLPPS